MLNVSSSLILNIDISRKFDGKQFGEVATIMYLAMKYVKFQWKVQLRSVQAESIQKSMVDADIMHLMYAQHDTYF